MTVSVTVCVVWDDDERKGEGETWCRLIACSSRKAPRGLLGVSLLFKITIDTYYLIYVFF